MATHKCENCSFRKQYDKNSRSLLGRFWKWHTRWCPGWKKYVRENPGEERRVS
jgi:hypothetical protein